MTIEVEIAGTDQIAEFPDGTSPEVIRQTLSAQAQQSPEVTLGGVADVAGAAIAGLGEQALGGALSLSGLAAGQDIPTAIAGAETITGAIPDPTIGPEGQATIQAISEKFKATPEIVQQIVQDFMTLGPSLAEPVQRLGTELGLPAPVTAAASTAVRMIPEVLETVTGIKALRSVAGASKLLPELAAETTQAGQQVATGLFQFQSPTKRKIAEKIAQGSTDVETARFKLDPKSVTRDPATGKVIPSAKPTGKIEEFFAIGAPRVQADPKATEAIRQGFDEGVIAAIKGADPVDRQKMLAMTRLMEKGKKDQRFALTHRPSDVVGDSLMTRLNIIKGANTSAGKQLDRVAKDLKGRPVAFREPIESFVSDLDDMGIGINQRDGQLSLDFSGSDIEGLAGPEAALTRIFKRMNTTRPIDGFELHRMKRFIDEQVTFGKTAEGLSGKTERVLKTLRRNLDQTLDEAFPEYDRINSAYSETRSALDAFQDVAGKKLDLSGEKAGKATGQLLRRLMSNAQSRINLLDSVEDIERVAKKFEGFKGKLDPSRIEGTVASKINDDLLTQVLFVDELDKVFGAVARTSLQGQVEQAVKQAAGGQKGLQGIIIDQVAKKVEGLRGINPEGAFQSIKSVLEEQ